MNICPIANKSSSSTEDRASLVNKLLKISSQYLSHIKIPGFNFKKSESSKLPSLEFQSEGPQPHVTYKVLSGNYGNHYQQK